MFRTSVKDAEAELEKIIIKQFPEIKNQNFVVKNEAIIGKILGELKIREMTGAVVSGVVHDEIAATPTISTIPHQSDLVKAIGSNSSLEKIRLHIGMETGIEIPLDPYYEVILSW